MPPKPRAGHKGARSKTRDQAGNRHLDYVTHRGDKDFHEGGHNQRRKRRPYRKGKRRGGSSNAGEYASEGLRKSQFAGPAGGAKAGTYPINTLARARSALRFAHYAPNPAGIRAKVCSKWGDRIKSCQ